jgi:FSR family fosmidomycin resistance protein-like MFS transporter
MSSDSKAVVNQPQTILEESTVLAVLGALSLSHLLNDVMQSLLPAVYPLLKQNYALSFFQVGLITFAFHVTASLLQPLVGLYTDRRPWAYSLLLGTLFTLTGLISMAVAGSFATILVAASLIGMGSSIFHPEASRVARLASGGRYGFAQSLFQVGGNTGSAIGPLLAAYIVMPRGQASLAWFTVLVLAASGLLTFVGRWYERHLAFRRANPRPAHHLQHAQLSPTRVRWAIAILLLLVFSKYIYMVSLSSYYTFYLMNRFDVSITTAQLYLFVFLGAVAAGTFGGGPVGDRFGFKTVIWVSILGVLPFTLILPYMNLFWTAVLTVPIGLILASAFSAIIVYAQELLPSRVGMVAGMFFGFAFGMAGIGAAALGWMADQIGIEAVYQICAFLPLMGLLTWFLPNLEPGGRQQRDEMARDPDAHLASPELDA